MPDRRQFLAATAAAAMLPLAQEALLPCPAAVPGAATASNLLVPVDCFALGKQGAAFQWQDGVVVSDKAGACDHYRANQIVGGEKWLVVTLIGSRDPQDFAACPYPATPITLTVGQGTPDGAGNLYTVAATYKAHNSSCKGTQQDATAGTVTYTLATDQALEASFDLAFAAGQVTGTFVAPFCDTAGCPPRPSRPTCVSA